MTHKPDKHELAWRDRCRDEVIRCGRASGAIDEWLNDRGVAITGPPCVDAEEAESFVAAMTAARHTHGGAA